MNTQTRLYARDGSEISDFLCRHARCSPAIVSLRAAGGFGEKPKQDTKKSEPVVKVSLDEKAADPKKALDADVEEMRKAMGGGGSTTIKGFEDGAEVPSVPELQVLCTAVSLA